MSLAPASSLGAFLKARFAVNGIQWAARSFGTVTAAGRGLLSSMGASSSFGAWRSREAISFVAIRERHDPLYLRSIRRFEGVQGDVQRIDEALEVVGDFHLAVQLPAKRLDQPGSEALTGRRVNPPGRLFRSRSNAAVGCCRRWSMQSRCVPWATTARRISWHCCRVR